MHGTAVPPQAHQIMGKLNSFTEISEYLPLSLEAKTQGTVKDLLSIYVSIYSVFYPRSHLIL